MGHYGNGHRGVAIEFDTNELAAAALNHHEAQAGAPLLGEESVWSKVEYGMVPSRGVRSWRTLSDQTHHRVRNIGFLQRDNLLGCQLHGNRCDRIIEVVELGGADNWCGNDRL